MSRLNIKSILFPDRKIENPEWRKIWNDRDIKRHSKTSKIAFCISIVVYILHYFFVDTHFPQHNPTVWFWYRFGMAGFIAILLGISMIKPLAESQFRRLPMIIACLTITAIQTYSMNWYAEIHIFFSFFLPVVIIMYIEGSLLSLTILYILSMATAGFVFITYDLLQTHFFLSQCIVWYVPIIFFARTYSNRVNIFILEQKNEDLHEQVKTHAHNAGMATVAVNFTHTLGNILTSATSSLQKIRELTQTQKTENIVKALDLVETNKDDLSNYLLNDAKGKKIPQFLKLFAEKIEASNQTKLEELSKLRATLGTMAKTIRYHGGFGGKVVLNENFELNKIIVEIVNKSKNTLQPKGITISYKGDHDISTRLQKSKFQHIIHELIDNATNSIINENSEGLIKIKLKTDNKTVQVSVKDNGKGIKKESIDKVFEQGYSTYEDKSGLGLHICSNYVQEMGGEIKVNSSDKETEFEISLPIKQ